MEKNRIKNNVGITLIALIISIIVMLILAGVTINLTLGENGIFTTAQQAAKNYANSQEKELAYLEGFTNEVNNIVNPAPLGTIIKTENGINYTADGAGNAIPVPIGFSPITTEDQGTKLTGFVIKNNTDGNEFVWIPVEGMSYTYNRYAFLKIQPWDETHSNGIKMNFTNEYYTETLPTDEQKSVAAYGGYYIGRYETGIKDWTLGSEISDGSTTWTGYTTGSLVVQPDQQVWNYITRDRAIIETGKLYNKQQNNVTSKLCSSYAWNTALKFIETQNSTYPTNSTGGNYNLQTGGRQELQNTGYHAVNNIYDMGGNVWEWITEIYSDNENPYTVCGGAWNGSAPDHTAAYRSYNNKTAMSDKAGFRVALFM